MALLPRLYECIEFLRKQEEDDEELEMQIEQLQQALKLLLGQADPR